MLHEFGKPPTVETLTDPVPGPNEMMVAVAAAAILPYANEVFDGTRRYLLDLPVVPGPGAIGRVRATGPDIGGLAPGDWVTCDPTLRSRDGAPTPEIMLQGWSARAQGGLRLQRRFGNGSYAEQMLTPAENVFPIGAIDPAEAARWCALLPPAAGPAPARAAALTVREFGRVVLMGGIRDDLALPYMWLMRNSVTVRGQWMYPPAANIELIKLVRSGLLDLGIFEVTEFGLADVQAAVDHAASHPRSFQLTALRL